MSPGDIVSVNHDDEIIEIPEAPSDEEIQLYKIIRQIQESCSEQMKPYIERLTKIKMNKPPSRFIIGRGARFKSASIAPTPPRDGTGRSPL